MAEAVTRDYIRETCARHLGLMESATIDAVIDDDTVTINRLADLSPDPDRMRDTFLYIPALDEWRRVLRFGYPANNDVTLSRAISASPGYSAQLYFLLTPDDWNAIINEVLPDLSYQAQADVTLTAGTYVYDLPAPISTAGQVMKVEWLDTRTPPPPNATQAIGRYTLGENANTVQLTIREALPDPATYRIRVTYRANYAPLQTDASTTTCPRDLWLHGVAVGAIQRIKNRYGPVVGKLFAERGVLEERDLAKARDKWLPRFVAAEYYHDEFWTGPDVNRRLYRSNWVMTG